MDAKKLKVGEHYFLLFYHPVKDEIPFIKTCIYTGNNYDMGIEASEEEWYFEDPRLFYRLIDTYEGGESIEDSKRILLTKELLELVLDLNGLIKKLTEIAKRKK